MNAEIADLVILDQGYERRGTESTYGVEVKLEITVPGTCKGTRLIPAWAEGDTNAAKTTPKAYLGNLKWV